MKKRVLTILLMVVALPLVSCDSGGNEVVLQNDSANESSNLEASVVEPESEASVEEGINNTGMVDLTELSSTMVYAEVYNMMARPEDYIGKSVKMQGKFVVIENPESDELYTACLIEDATGCCAQGIEFVLGNGAIFPDDYPEVDEVVTVTGVYETYEKDGLVYCYLLDSTIG